MTFVWRMRDADQRKFGREAKKGRSYVAHVHFQCNPSYDGRTAHLRDGVPTFLLRLRSERAQDRSVSWISIGHLNEVNGRGRRSLSP